jgi:hypothetical protein
LQVKISAPAGRAPIARSFGPSSTLLVAYQS